MRYRVAYIMDDVLPSAGSLLTGRSRQGLTRCFSKNDPEASQLMGCPVLFNRDEEANALGLPAVGATEGALAAAAPLALSCWRGRASLNILVAKPECTQLAEKLRFAAKRKVRRAPDVSHGKTVSSGQ